MSQQDSGFGEHGKRWTAHDRRALTEGIKATKDHRAGLKTTTDHAQTIHDWIMVTYPAFDRTVEAVSRRLGAEFDSQARLERRAAKANAKEAREELEALKTLLQAKVINEKEHAEKLAAVEDELKTYVSVRSPGDDSELIPTIHLVQTGNSPGRCHQGQN